MCRFNSSTTSATRLIVSAGFFSFSVVIIFLHILVYIILWLCWEYLFLLGIYLLIVFYLVASAVSFPVTISLFMGFLFIYFAFLILNPILHRNSLMLHKGCLLSSILSCFIYLLSKKTFFITNFAIIFYSLSSIFVTKLYQTRYTFRFEIWHLYYQSSLFHSWTATCFFQYFLMAGLSYYIQTNVVSLIFYHLNLLKFSHFIKYIIWFLYTLSFSL